MNDGDQRRAERPAGTADGPDPEPGHDEPEPRQDEPEPRQDEPGQPQTDEEAETWVDV